LNWNSGIVFEVKIAQKDYFYILIAYWTDAEDGELLCRIMNRKSKII